MQNYDIGNKVLEFANKYGADEAEVFISANQVTSASVRRNLIESARNQQSQGLGIRVVKEGAVGFASTNIFNRLEETVKSAIAMAKVRDSDEDWKNLPSNGKYPSVNGIFSKKVNELELEDCISLTKEMIDGVCSFSDIIAPSGSFSRMISNQLIMNTNGVEVEEKGTAVSGFIDVITTSDIPSTAYDFRISRDMDIDFYGIGKEAANLANSCKKGVSVESGQKDVVFHPFAFSDIMESSFLSSIEADNIQKGRSSLAGKLNTDIAARGLTITDDGILNGGIASSISDDEGTPSQSTGIIKDGLLKSYIYDSYTAGKEERSSTGNAVRGSYTSTPSVGSRNVVFDHPASDIISEIKDGVFVTNVIGAHTANPISGDFSVEARNAFVIKDGQIEKPIKSLMVSGNIFELLRNVKGAGNDVRMVGSIITPSIWVSNMNVIG